MARRWTVEDIPSLQGKVALITGANSGIGFEAALALAGKQAQVILGVRNAEKGQTAMRKISSLYPQAKLEAMPLDLADLNSIKQFSETFDHQYSKLDILINNAGIMAIPFQRTIDGFERQFGTNHLGHFALTGRLMPVILAAPAARVVTVSSVNHIFGRIDFDNLDGTKSYGPWGAYNRSKLANLLFVYQLQRWFQARQARAISVGCHPGYSATHLQIVGPQVTGSKALEALMQWANKTFAQSATMGALPALFAATAEGVQGGDYIGPQGLGGMGGFPGKARSSHRSHETAVAQRLWEVSEKLTGVTF